MDTAKIRGLAELMRETGLTKLRLEEQDTRLTLEMHKHPPTEFSGFPSAPEQPENRAAAEQILEPGVSVVRAPMVGVFYAAASPGEKVFAAVGDSVKKGDVLCIIEAMKLMNEIVAEQDGAIIEVCVGNGQVVEFGQPLFKMR